MHKYMEMEKYPLSLSAWSEETDFCLRLIPQAESMWYLSPPHSCLFLWEFSDLVSSSTKQQAAAESFLHITRRQYFVLWSSSSHLYLPSPPLLLRLTYCYPLLLYHPVPPLHFSIFGFIGFDPSSSFRDAKINQLPAVFGAGCSPDSSILTLKVE